MTLLTGDQVTITTLTGGTRGVTVDAAPGRSGLTFVEQHTEEGGLRVIPADALELIAAGRLDPRLFDITGLIDQGYDDASSPHVPLIVRYEDGLRAHATASAELTGAGADVERELPSINSAAVQVPKQATAQLWEQLTADEDAPRTLDAGIANIRLDGRVQASLDESVPLIGAPSAWESGYTGEGVRVAVLDSGIDANHPDMAESVVEAEDFTDSYGGTADLFGHGTHVASIVAGDGAASDGQYSGVAPDAELLVGKVLDDFGGGTESWVITGMEWAVAHDADVVNLSLGSCATDGSDSVSEALDALAEQAGTLFVVAAGNHPSSLSCGYPETVASPAAADHAVAVGSINKQGELSEFSNTGPRLGDGAVKPELTAPGESIVAARADGTFEDVAVGDHYARLSGTSMAAPHVAGVAALLAEQHPEWTAAELVPALLGSAVPRPGLGAFDQGAGRVDAARAIAQHVVTSPAKVSMGVAAWPHDDDEPITTTLTYRNTGDEAVTLDLSVTAFGEDGTPAPDGIFDVTPAEITVPAGGSTEVAVTANTSIDSPDGAYSGWVSGDAADGTPVVTTPIGVVKEVESYDVTIEAIGRDGDPASTLAAVGDLAAEAVRNVFIDSEPVTLRLPAGMYDVNSLITTRDWDDPDIFSITLVARPELVVDRDTHLSLDARDGRLITATVDSTTAQPGQRYAFLATAHDHDLAMGTDNETEFYATPTPQVTAYDYTFGYQSSLSEPEPEAGAERTGESLPRGYRLYFSETGRIPDPSFRVRDSELARLDTTLHSQGVADQQTARLVAWPVTITGRSGHGQGHVVEIPSKRIELYTGGPSIRWATELFAETFEEIDYHGSLLSEYRAGQRYDKHWNAAPLGPVVQPRFASGYIFVRLSPFSSSSYRHFTYPGWDLDEITTTLTKDGELVGTSDDPSGGFYELPAERATYELTTSARRQVDWSTLATSVDATWKVTAGPDEATGYLPLLALRIAGDVDLHGQAPANRPFKLELRAERADGHDPTVRSISLDVSFDDGTTWQPMRLRPVGDGFTTLVPRPPNGSEFVSLRASVEDTDGSQLDQTVIRAYKLAAP